VWIRGGECACQIHKTEVGGASRWFVPSLPPNHPTPIPRAPNTQSHAATREHTTHVRGAPSHRRTHARAHAHTRPPSLYTQPCDTPTTSPQKHKSKRLFCCCRCCFNVSLPSLSLSRHHHFLLLSSTPASHATDPLPAAAEPPGQDPPGEVLRPSGRGRHSPAPGGCQISYKYVDHTGLAVNNQLVF
jgi:hypothetical protein